MPEVQDYSAEELSFARDAFGMEGPLANYKANGVAVALEGTDNVEGHSSYRMNVTLPSGAIHQVWIDAHTYLMLKYDRKVPTAGDAGTVSVYYRNYQTREGLTLPLTIETRNAGQSKSDKMVIDRIALNPRLDDAQFIKPTGSKHRGATPRVNQPASQR